jgi:hypothetical protein
MATTEFQKTIIKHLLNKTKKVIKKTSLVQGSLCSKRSVSNARKKLIINMIDLLEIRTYNSNATLLI